MRWSRNASPTKSSLPAPESIAVAFDNKSHGAIRPNKNLPQRSGWVLRKIEVVKINIQQRVNVNYITFSPSSSPGGLGIWSNSSVLSNFHTALHLFLNYAAVLPFGWYES